MNTLRTRTDVVLEALKLKVEAVRGDRAWIHCPFHGGTSSSAFFVRRSGDNAGRYCCFSCKEKGGIVMLTMHVRGCDRDEAKKFVRAAGKGFAPPRAKVRIIDRPRLFGRPRFELPGEMIREPFAAWVGLARSYLEGRGLGEREVERFGLGYAVDGQLAGRVIIPYTDERGRPGSYSARSLVGEDPKYKTPPEAEAPDLDVVFGSHLWPKLDARKQAVAIVHEGAVDAMSADRVVDGAAHVAAINGSDVRPGHVLALASFGAVVIATDADAPGDRAAATIASGVARHARTHRLRLPRDANTMLVEEPGELLERIMCAVRAVAP